MAINTHKRQYENISPPNNKKYKSEIKGDKTIIFDVISRSKTTSYTTDYINLRNLLDKFAL